MLWCWAAPRSGTHYRHCPHREGAHVLAVARQLEPLVELSGQLPGIKTLAIDAASENAPVSVFEALQPDLLVICVGAKRTAAPLQELDWEEFTRTWDIDVKASFFFCKAALSLPLPQGDAVECAAWTKLVD